MAGEPEILKRLGTSRESVARLSRKAAEAETALGIHGVSVTTGTPRGPASTAPRPNVEQHFRVHDTPTRADPMHRTIELLKPVTQQTADLFNRLFGRIYKHMNKKLSTNLSWREGANCPSPVQRLLAFGYYDGPTEGVLQCSNEETYRFDLLAWEPETQDLRIFCLSPLPSSGWDQLTALCAAQESPRWPVWVVGWHEGLYQPIQEILRQVRPVEWVVATEDLRGEILRVKAVGPQELAQITNWGAFLGLTEEVRDVGSYLKAND